MTERASSLPSGVSRLESEIEVDEQKTKDDLKNPGPTAPLTPVNGDVRKIRGSNIATLPVEPVRTGFVNDEPSPVDDIRHAIPLLIRIGGQVYCVKSYLQAGREFSAKPPLSDWDDRIVMETK